MSRWRVHGGQPARIDRRLPGDTGGGPGTREETEAASAAQIDSLSGLQDRLWAEGERSLLVVLQGVDAAGKDGTVKRVFRGLNPQGVRVTSFKVPTHLEASHDFLWRVHAAAPAAGEIAIFNRSHYEDVLVARVHELVGRSVWTARYDHITAFERLLAHRGTTVVKLFLHISKDEQDRRLAERLGQPEKRWKLQESDFLERTRWDDYQAAYEDALNRTSTDDAPWYVVPADHKWFRNWVVGEILVGTLSKMDPRYPQSSMLPEAPSP